MTSTHWIWPRRIAIAAGLVVGLYFAWNATSPPSESSTKDGAIARKSMPAKALDPASNSTETRKVEPEPTAGVSLAAVVAGGRFITTGGTPVPNVVRSLTLSTPTTTVDAQIRVDGTWEARLFPGEWKLTLTRHECPGPVPTYPGQLTISGPSTNTDIVLLDSGLVGRVHGYVRDCMGASIPGVTVRVAANEAVTNQLGYYSVGCVSREVPPTVHVEESSIPSPYKKPWWQTNESFAFGAIGGSLQSFGEAPQASLAGTDSSFDVVLSKGVSLTGTILGPAGEPLPNVIVSIRQSKHPRVQMGSGINCGVKTDETGRFQTPALPPGQWVAFLFQWAKEGVATPDPVRFELMCDDEDKEMNIQFMGGIGAGIVEGQFVDYSGTSGAGETFGLWRLEDHERHALGAFCQTKAWTTVQHDGRFALAGLADGEYVLERIELAGSKSGVIYVDSVPSKPFIVSSGHASNPIEWEAMSFPRTSASVRSYRATTNNGGNRVELGITIAMPHRKEPWSKRTTLTVSESTNSIDGVPAGNAEIELFEVDSVGGERLIGKTTAIFSPERPLAIAYSENSVWQVE